MGTGSNLSAVFTKILGPNKFGPLRDCIMVAVSMPAAQEEKAASNSKVFTVGLPLQVSGR